MHAFGYDIDGFGLVHQSAEPKPPATPKQKPPSDKLPPPEKEAVVHVLDKPIKLAKDTPQAPKYEIEFVGGFKRPKEGKFVSVKEKTVQGPGVATAGSALDTEQKDGDVEMEDVEMEDADDEVPEEIAGEDREEAPPPPAREASPPPPLPAAADEAAELRSELERTRAAHARDLASHQSELDARERRHADELNRVHSERQTALWDASQRRIAAESEADALREEFSKRIGSAHHQNALLQRQVQETEASRATESREHHERIEKTQAEIAGLSTELDHARSESANARKELAVLSQHGGASAKMLADKEEEVERFRRRTVELENSIAAKEAWHTSALENLQAQLRQTHGDRAIRLLEAGPSRRPGTSPAVSGELRRRHSPPVHVSDSSDSEAERPPPRHAGLDTPMLEAPPLAPHQPAIMAAPPRPAPVVIPQPANDRMMVDLPGEADDRHVLEAAAVLVPRANDIAQFHQRIVDPDSGEIQADSSLIEPYDAQGKPTIAFYRWVRHEINKHVDKNRKVPNTKRGLAQIEHMFPGGLRDWAKRFERTISARDDVPQLEPAPNPKRRQLFPQ